MPHNQINIGNVGDGAKVEVHIPTPAPRLLERLFVWLKAWIVGLWGSGYGKSDRDSFALLPSDDPQQSNARPHRRTHLRITPAARHTLVSHSSDC